MNKLTSAFVFAVAVAFSASAMAVPGGEPNNTGCNGVGNANSPCEPAGGGEGEGDGGTGTGIGVGVGVGLGVGHGVGSAESESTSRASADASSKSQSEAAAIAAQQQQQEQILRNTNNIDVGGDTTTVRNGSESNSAAVNGGNTLIIGGASFGEGQEGEGSVGGSTLSPVATATASNGDQVNTQQNAQTVGDTNVTVVNEGLSTEAARELGQPDIVNVDARSEEVDNSQLDTSTTINNNNNYKQAVASAAPVFSSVCTSGASTQTRSFGFGLAVTSSVCEHLMMADAFNAVGNSELVNKHLIKASKIANFRGSLSQFRSLITIGIL